MKGIEPLRALLKNRSKHALLGRFGLFLVAKTLDLLQGCYETGASGAPISPKKRQNQRFLLQMLNNLARRSAENQLRASVLTSCA
ncbi:MAG: hypothetical protein KC462_00625 [Cyanobacteria bacterium HKST-UBA05]|nr:hypothetical protein [Cyanobacteria bacterium HKST-UBA05]